MEKINYLRKLVNVIWYVYLITIPIYILSVLQVLGFINLETDHKWLHLKIQKYDSFENLSNFFIDISMFIIVLITLFFFRKIITSFSRKLIFDKQIISYFYHIGKILMLASLLKLIQTFIIPIILNSKTEIQIGLTPFMLLFGSSLFFLVLGEVFTAGNKLREENDLTI